MAKVLSDTEAGLTKATTETLQKTEKTISILLRAGYQNMFCHLHFLVFLTVLTIGCVIWSTYANTTNYLALGAYALWYRSGSTLNGTADSLSTVHAITPETITDSPEKQYLDRVLGGSFAVLLFLSFVFTLAEIWSALPTGLKYKMDEDTNISTENTQAVTVALNEAAVTISEPHITTMFYRMVIYPVVFVYLFYQHGYNNALAGSLLFILGGYYPIMLWMTDAFVHKCMNDLIVFNDRKSVV